MMIALIILKSSPVPLIEGLYTSISCYSVSGV